MSFEKQSQARYMTCYHIIKRYLQLHVLVALKKAAFTQRSVQRKFRPALSAVFGQSRVRGPGEPTETSYWSTRWSNRSTPI